MLLDILFPMNHVIIDQLALNSVGICLHNMLQISLQKTVEKVSPILVTLTSRSDSDFEWSNISLKENKRDGVDSNSNGFDYCVKEKFYGFRQTEILCKSFLCLAKIGKID